MKMDLLVDHFTASLALVARKVCEVSVKNGIFKIRFEDGETLTFEVSKELNPLDGQFDFCARVKMGETVLMEGRS